jgi:hypothetical protein
MADNALLVLLLGNEKRPQDVLHLDRVVTPNYLLHDDYLVTLSDFSYYLLHGTHV